MSRNEVLSALQKGFGHDFGRYVKLHLSQALEDRGLLVASKRKWLGLISYTSYSLTPAGEIASAPLRHLKHSLDAMPTLVREDPERALALARSAGVLVVLSPKAKRQIPALRKLVQTMSGGNGEVTFVGASSADDGDADWKGAVDHTDMDLSLGADGWLGPLESVADFTSGDGGSGDGGDGGGGGD